MKRFTQILGVVLVAGLVLAVVSSNSLAGRTGGPMSSLVTVPAGQSVYFDVHFQTGTAVVAIHGNGQAVMQVFLYDSDGHVATGIGPLDQKTAQMNVYRPGMFRIEVLNAGILADTVTVATN